MSKDVPEVTKGPDPGAQYVMPVSPSLQVGSIEMEFPMLVCALCKANLWKKAGIWVHLPGPSFCPSTCANAGKRWRVPAIALAAEELPCLYERVRWHFQVEKGLGEEFKLNNNFHSRYARLIMKTYPELDGFFELRKLTSGEDSFL